MPRSEHAEAKYLVEWWRLSHARYGLDEDELYHVPNEARRSRATRGRLKAEGMRPGLPDYYLDVPRGPYHGLRIELKSETGRLTPGQRRTIERLCRRGYRAVMCRGWVQASEVIREYLEQGESTNGKDHGPPGPENADTAP